MSVRIKFHVVAWVVVAGTEAGLLEMLSQHAVPHAESAYS